VKKTKLSVIIPVYNEKDTIKEIIAKVQSEKTEKEIIIIDDKSTDGTRKILQEMAGKPGLKILYHDKNRGKGAALRTGFKAVAGDIVIIQDADLEYDPAEYSKLVAPIIEDKADVVYGSRFLGEPHRVLLYWHYIGNKLLTAFTNLLTNLNLTDMETCYKVFRASILKEISFKSNSFNFEPEFTVKVAKKGYKIYETAISYSGRDYSEGKKIGWLDGFIALFTILRYRLFD
jgi:glycosyltransferase involved in cell wall biosynthesis